MKNISNEALEAIKFFEGFRATAYKPVKTEKYYTIGYGHYGADVKKGQTITKEQATELLKKDVSVAEDYVNRLQLSLTQGQFDALVDFAFNLGTLKLASSTLLRYIKAGRPASDIHHEFRKWKYAGGQVLKGLVLRRAWECEMWDK